MLAASDDSSDANDVVRICNDLCSVLHIVCADVDKFESMISFLFQSKWLSRGDKGGPEGKQIAVCDAFAAVLKRLVSYDSSFANRCYEIIVKSLQLLRPPPDAQRDAQQMVNAMKEFLQTTQSQSLHRLVTEVNKIAPLSISAFVSVLSRSFPHRRADAELQITFFTHALQFLSLIHI